MPMLESIWATLHPKNPQKRGMRGMEMEMLDGNFPLWHKMTFTTDDAQAFKGADYAILLGAFPKQDGLDKRDIMEKNVMIFRTMGRSLEQHVKPDCKILVVGSLDFYQGNSEGVFARTHKL